MRACTPHECVAIHNFTFLSEAFISTCCIPTYEKFLRLGRYGPAYAWQRYFLQHLQSRYPTERWVLKSPDHLHALDELFANFPDAVVIHIHRNPLEVLRSSLQLASVLHGLFGRPGDPNQLQDHEARRIYQHLDCPLTQTTLERMRHLIASRSRYRGRQNPTLDDLRLDAAVEIPRFRNYRLRFGIPMPSS